MGNIAFLFAGQGAQKVGMGLFARDLSARARRIFDQASRVLGYDVVALIGEGPAERLAETEITQPTVLTASLAVWAALDERGIQPDMAAGLSLGEYGALVASGAMGAADAIAVVRERGRLMQDAVPLGSGGMVAVLGMEASRLEALCREVTDGVVEVANLNAPGQVVVAGETRALETLKARAREAGARRLVDLPVSAPFHSSLLAGAGEGLREPLGALTFGDPSFPVISNVTAAPIRGAGDIFDLLVRQVSHPVRFEESLRRMAELGADTFVEIGPGRSLGGFAKRVAPEAAIYNTDDAEAFGAALAHIEEVRA